jgi:acetoacetate decarboxylase
MGFVKTPDEVARIERAITHPRFVNGEMLTVDFLTDPAFVAEVLPPPLEPADVPRVTAMVSRWQSNCVGDFASAAIYVAARHDGGDGDYVLAMYMDGDVPIIYGRDVFGEPKKLGQSRLYRRSGNEFCGHLDRNGVRLIDLRADLPTDLGPSEGDGVNFNFKARPAADGVGLEDDAILTRAVFHQTVRLGREGTGTVTFGGTVHDPLDEIPIESFTRALFVECDLIAQCRAVATTPADTFLPYHHGRHDDWSALDTENAAVAVAH